MRIIAERDAGHWSAWRKDDPATALGGSDPAMAVKRLCNLLGLGVCPKNNLPILPIGVSKIA
ncbi:MAG: hypothetical protein IID54_07740 [Proteobacteria bacterium]|nr:hypothetical protein [Pseudomonadota bacterium]